MHYVTGFLVQLLILAFLVVVGFFVAANSQSVPLNLPFGNQTFELPLWLPVLLSFMLGFILAFSIGSFSALFLKWNLRRTQRKLAKEQEAQAEQQKQQPAKEQNLIS